MTSQTGAAGARRRLNRIHSLRRPNTRPFRMRRTTRALFGWGGWAKLASIVTTVAALAALWFTSQSLHATNDQYGLARQTATTERFAKATEQLGNSAVDVRLGGIYLLERLASDSPADRPTIFEVLGSFVRGHSPIGPDCGKVKDQRLPIDVQAVVTVIGRRGAHSTEKIDLSETCLANGYLRDANLRGAQLRGANLAGAELEQADLTEAALGEANLSDASLWGADLQSARLDDANLQRTNFQEARLRHANFNAADLRDAYLGGADMRNVYFDGANLRGAQLKDTGYAEARLDHVVFVKDWTTEGNENLQGASFNGARFDDSTRWPPGFTPIR
ncbi:pentapeptide repeat-containing protein [Nocardia sp. NPDC004068]|uniref:pentapeptide repeat-containing protein n=1 Tax=Nocardia sp. NPDC004068 TaxID=3364303 RepID=UPI003678C68F